MEEKKLYVIGIGPGAREQMTVRADRILRESQVIIGYTVYVDLVKEFYPQAEFLTTPMRQEKERCEMALKAAQDGRKTAMICSGDSGVYGMAGLVLQMAEAYPDVNVEVIPGVTAALGGGAILGAPLGHDFAVISLSDLLTPMEVIEKRLRAAAEADFIICLYNPSSRKRHDYLERACRILLEYKSGETAWKNFIGRGSHGAVNELNCQDSRTKSGWDITGIPRFLLIDEHFNIISADAPRPSQKEIIEPILKKLSKK